MNGRRVVDERAVRALAARQAQPVMTSFYLDVDGRRYPRPSDVATRATHLFHLARDAAEPYGKEVRHAVDGDLARISAWLDHGLDRSRMRGVAAFGDGGDGFFEAFGLPLSVRDQVVVAPRADVAQLCTHLATSESALLVAADRQRSRLLHLHDGGVEEVTALFDAVDRQVDTDLELGSFERRHEEQARHHFRRVADAVVRELRAQPARHVVLTGPPEAVAHVEGYLPKRVVGLVAGRLTVPVRAGTAELADAARDAVREARRQRQAAVVAALRDRAAERAAAVTGLVGTLAALAAGRVETLLVEEGFSARGGRCGDCGQLVAGFAHCPACGTVTEDVVNVVDAAVTDAFVHHVALELCDAGQLADLGHMGALERR